MNSPFFDKKQLAVFLEAIAPYVTINDQDMFLALICSFIAHGGKQDKEGKPYFWHPLRVSSMVVGKDKKIIAVLHDVLEDSTITSNNLYEMGFSDLIVETVQILSRKKFQRYEDYLEQVAQNALAKEIKIADIKDNANPERLKQLDELTRKRLIAKYSNALTVLSR